MVITRAAIAAMRFMLFPSVCLEWPQLATPGNVVSGNPGTARIACGFRVTRNPHATPAHRRAEAVRPDGGG